jgi:hypothetical protein
MPQPLFVRGATLIDGTDHSPRPATSVLIEDGRVTSVGPSAQLEPPPGAEFIDGTGKFVIPGLIDMHIHVELCGGREGLPIWLGAGITTIRDVGGSPEGMLPLRDEVAAGTQVGPRISPTARSLTVSRRFSATARWLEQAPATSPGSSMTPRGPKPLSMSYSPSASMGSSFMRASARTS